MTTTKQHREGRLVMTLYLGTGLALVVLLMLAGLAMRLGQAGWLKLASVDFYSLLTLHGAGMIAAMVLCGMGGLWYLVRREVDMSLAVGLWAFGTALTGIVLVAVAAGIGKFAAAWTFLYPLPFVNPTWPQWSTGAFLIGLTLVVVGWAVWCIQLLEAVLRGYGGFRGILGIDMVFRPKAFAAAGRKPAPPQMLPAFVIAFDGLIAATAASLLGVALIVHWLDPSVRLDPLWAKNLTYFFGHDLANFIIYMLIAQVYVGLPLYTRRPWPNTTVLTIGWWGTLLFLLLAFPHHLYMDFAQPVWIQYVGTAASYLSALPVAVVTVFGGVLLVWGSGMRWALGSIFMFAGLAGWIVGGIGALLDATIHFNTVLHNTLWVPAHFHTYLLGGSFLFAIGWAFAMVEGRSPRTSSAATRWVVAGSVLVGIALLLASFYVAGAAGVPRRYDVEPDPGALWAGVGSVGAIVLILGLLVGLVEGVRIWRGLKQPRAMGDWPWAPEGAAQPQGVVK